MFGDGLRDLYYPAFWIPVVLPDPTLSLTAFLFLITQYPLPLLPIYPPLAQTQSLFQGGCCGSLMFCVPFPLSKLCSARTLARDFHMGCRFSLSGYSSGPSKGLLYPFPLVCTIVLASLALHKALYRSSGKTTKFDVEFSTYGKVFVLFFLLILSCEQHGVTVWSVEGLLDILKSSFSMWGHVGTF